MHASTLAVAATLAASAAASAATITTDFSGLANGANVEGAAFNAGTLAEFTATSSGNNQGLRIFDTTPGGPNQNMGDNDLLVAGFGNALILQDNQGPTPNDANEGGTILFSFTSAVELVSIDLIDIDANAAVTVTLTDSNTNTRTFSVPDNWTGEPGQGGAPGVLTLDFNANNQAGFNGNTATFLDSGLFDLTSVVSAAFDLDGSAALDNLRAVVVPLPTSAGLAAAGLALLGARRRR